MKALRTETGHDQDSWNHAWLPLLPAGAVVRAGLIADNEPPAHPAEEAFLTSVTAESRLREHRAGRRLAREALRAAGASEVPILNDAAGAPQWPAGWTGSITHGRGAAAAAVVPASLCPALGIDLEQVARVRDTLRKMILSPAEVTALETEWAGREQEFQALVFSAKEAFFKAQWPLLGLRPGWKEVTLEIEPHSGKFELFTPLGAGSNLRWGGRYSFHEDTVLTAVWIH